MFITTGPDVLQSIKHHFIREAIEEGEVELKFCKSKEQAANIFTKALPKEKFQQLRKHWEFKSSTLRGRMLQTNVL
jgi:hypothetical protein